MNSPLKKFLGKYTNIIFVILVYLPLSCFFQKGVTSEELSKCDRIVKKILQDIPLEGGEIRTRTDESGKLLYHVIVQSTDNKIFSEFGIKVISSFGNYYVAWVSKEEIVRLVKSHVVKSVKRGNVHGGN